MPGLWTVAVLDVDIEQRRHRGVPVSEAAELSGQARDLTPPVEAVLVNESEKRTNCLSFLNLSSLFCTVT